MQGTNQLFDHPKPIIGVGPSSPVDRQSPIHSTLP